MKVLALALVLASSGCGHEYSDTQSEGGRAVITIGGGTLVKDAIRASQPSVSITRTGKVDLGDGNPHESYLVECTGYSGTIAIQGLGAFPCIDDEFKTVGRGRGGA